MREWIIGIITRDYTYMGVSQNQGYHFRGPNNKDYSILGSILGSPYFGKLPYRNYKRDPFPHSLLSSREQNFGQVLDLPVPTVRV